MLHGLKRALLETGSGHLAKAIEDGKVPEEASAAGGRLAATPLQEGMFLTGVMDYDEACFMHLTAGVVHNFPKAVCV